MYTQLRKTDASGKMLLNLNIPLEELGVFSEREVPLVNTPWYAGPTGQLRASMRAVALALSMPYWQVLSHDRS